MERVVRRQRREKQGKPERWRRGDQPGEPERYERRHKEPHGGHQGSKPPPREKRRFASATPAHREAFLTERAKRDGWVYWKVGKELFTLRYRIQQKGNLIGAKELRWYFVGAVHVCSLKVNVEDMPPGRFVVYINSRAGNSGIAFSTEELAHNFIVDELSRSPRDQSFIMGQFRDRK